MKGGIYMSKFNEICTKIGVIGWVMCIGGACVYWLSNIANYVHILCKKKRDK